MISLTQILLPRLTGIFARDMVISITLINLGKAHFKGDPLVEVHSTRYLLAGNYEHPLPCP